MCRFMLKLAGVSVFAGGADTARDMTTSFGRKLRGVTLAGVTKV
jgi:hypothetical protein